MNNKIVLKLPVYNKFGERLSDELEVSIDSKFFDASSQQLIAQWLRWHRANLRAGTASTKRRSEVRGGGRKPWRQKGTGLARQGSIRSPHWRGGGIVFGPKPRDFSFSMPKKARRKAFLSALASRFKEGSVKVVEALELAEIKTKKFKQLMERLQISPNTLIIYENLDDKVKLSAANLPEVELRQVTSLELDDLLFYRWLLLTKDAADRLLEKLR